MYLPALISALMLNCFAGVSEYSFEGVSDDEWNEADGQIVERREIWHHVFHSLEVDPFEAEAIIFPEVLRWSGLKNSVEQAALRMFYIRDGKEGADFSIGLFQMKPSFAEKIECEWMNCPLRHVYRLYFGNIDDRHTRKERLDRLSDEQWQCVYLAMFMRLLLYKESSLACMDPAERIALMATAYNRDPDASLDQLRQYSKVRSFHFDLIPSSGTEYFSYQELSVDWYNHISNNL